MAFHDIRFPIDVALGASGGPEWATEIVTLASGHEERNSRWAHARRSYNAGYGVKSLSDIEQVLAFFQERRGRFHSFRWRDPFDFSSGKNSVEITALDCVLGTADGSNQNFQLRKIYGENFDPYVRNIAKPVAASLQVALDGNVAASGGYALDAESGVLNFAQAPNAGVEVTAGFLFDVEVRFDTDKLEIILASFEAGDIPHIPVLEVV